MRFQFRHIRKKNENERTDCTQWLSGQNCVRKTSYLDELQPSMGGRETNVLLSAFPLDRHICRPRLESRHCNQYSLHESGSLGTLETV